MTSFLNAQLPSDDEEDDEYDPSKDPTGEKEDAAGAQRRKRPRCARARRATDAHPHAALALGTQRRADMCARTQPSSAHVMLNICLVATR